MYYQTSALLFYSGKIFAGVLLCLFLGFFGITAPAFYLLFVGLIIPLFISLRLHSLKERGAVMLPANNSEWIVYVNGIPVRETRNTLSNPGFFSIDRARLFFASATGVKCCVQLASIILLVQQVSEAPGWLYLAAAIALGWMGYSLWQSTRALQSVLTRQWLIQSRDSGSGSQWYFGYFDTNGNATAALDSVLKL
ncbi:hypothetical protein [Siccibacter turicensis]|uniref:hypothetical protein n=1 Tax=Siccibacter turicensis TaxID=357233 RepID=UPI00102098FD|nr:hypothetical protein [Siccibacter turicensis]